MTVGELMEKLSHYNPQYKVCISDSCEDYIYDPCDVVEQSCGDYNRVFIHYED